MRHQRTQLFQALRRGRADDGADVGQTAITPPRLAERRDEPGDRRR